MLAARLLAVAVAVAVIAVLGVRLGDARSCASARTAVFAAVTGRGAQDRVPEEVRRIRDTCEGSAALVATAGALSTLGRRDEAVALAAEATRREPESFPAWRALATLERGDAAREAARRAQRLNPRWSPRPAG